MNAYPLSSVLFLYGSFLILCGIISVLFIGMKAKTALISGGTAGGLAILISYFVYSKTSCFATSAGILLSLALFIVFSWRATKTLFSVFDLIQQKHEDLKGKGIAFLIIALMAVVSLIVLGVQLVLASKGCCGVACNA